MFLQTTWWNNKVNAEMIKEENQYVYKRRKKCEQFYIIDAKRSPWKEFGRKWRRIAKTPESLKKKQVTDVHFIKC